MSSDSTQPAYLALESWAGRSYFNVKIVGETRCYYDVEYLEAGIGGRKPGDKARVHKKHMRFGDKPRSTSPLHGDEN